MSARTGTRPTRRRVEGSGGTNAILAKIKARPQLSAVAVGWLFGISCAVCSWAGAPVWAVFDTGLASAFAFGIGCGCEAASRKGGDGR